MRIVCTGGRDYAEANLVSELLERLSPTEIYVGDCPTGLDRLVREWADEKPKVSLTVYHADWEQYGKAAGPVRNGNMLDEAGNDAIVLAFKGGRGTADCMRQAKAKDMIVLETK